MGKAQSQGDRYNKYSLLLLTWDSG